MYDDVTQAIKCCGATVAPVIKGKFSEKVYMCVCVCVCVCCVYTYTNVIYLCALYETHRKHYFQGKKIAFSIQKLGNLLSSSQTLCVSSQKRPGYSTKEACFYTKRRLFLCQKRLVYDSKEACVYGKGDLLTP